jgi:hypothetical protein
MAEHRDASMSDVTIVLDARFAGKHAEATELLKQSGLDVTETDEDQGVVEGTVETCKITDLQKLDCVDYVRVEFTYIADYPTGDPRDLDKEPS